MHDIGFNAGDWEPLTENRSVRWSTVKVNYKNPGKRRVIVQS